MRDQKSKFICYAPGSPGHWLYKERTGHALGIAQLVHIDRVVGGEIFIRGQCEPMFWHGLWSGPVDMPAGWDAVSI